VKKVVPNDDHVRVETDRGVFRASVVVGADGSNGVTRRCIFPDAPVHTARVLEVITPSPPIYGRARSAGGGRQGQAYFDFFPVPSNIAGYVWDFPTQIRGEARRCWGIYDTNILAGEKRPQLKETLAKEMARFGLHLDQYPVHGHPIRWFSPTNPLSAPRVLLVGDAAGADPFLGEGISIALAYGALAGREIGEAFARQDFSFAAYRRRVLASSLGQALMARWLLAYVIYSFKWKSFQVLIWRILRPLGVLVAQLFVLNWGKRLKETR
jgi:flavin-dependent dehydrogenase